MSLLLSLPSSLQWRPLLKSPSCLLVPSWFWINIMDTFSVLVLATDDSGCRTLMTGLLSSHSVLISHTYVLSNTPWFMLSVLLICYNVRVEYSLLLLNEWPGSPDGLKMKYIANTVSGGLIVWFVWWSDSQVVWLSDLSDGLICRWSDCLNCLMVWFMGSLIAWLVQLSDLKIVWLSDLQMVWLSDLQMVWLSDLQMVWLLLWSDSSDSSDFSLSAISKTAQLLFRSSTTLTSRHSVLHPTRYAMYRISAPFRPTGSQV